MSMFSVKKQVVYITKLLHSAESASLLFAVEMEKGDARGPSTNIRPTSQSYEL